MAAYPKSSAKAAKSSAPKILANPSIKKYIESQQAAYLR
jgi:phage terminase small subunit